MAMEITKNINVIFDTDAGSDCDDMMALAYLIYARRQLGANLLAITHCLNGNYGIPAIRAFFRHYGEPMPNVGKAVNGVTLPDKYCYAVSDRFGISEDLAHVTDALSVLRRALAESEEKCALMAARDLNDYLKNGNINHSVNLPNVSLERMGVARLCVIHRNVPRMINGFLDLIGEKNINVEHMINKPRGEYAYTIIDTGSELDQEIIDKIKQMNEVLRVRVI